MVSTSVDDLVHAVVDLGVGTSFDEEAALRLWLGVGENDEGTLRDDLGLCGRWVGDNADAGEDEVIRGLFTRAARTVHQKKVTRLNAG